VKLPKRIDGRSFRISDVLSSSDIPNDVIHPDHIEVVDHVCDALGIKRKSDKLRDCAFDILRNMIQQRRV
jgi:hypothetical protein